MNHAIFKCLLFLGAGFITTAAQAGRAEWQSVRAVRDRKFLRVHGSEFNRPSPRIAGAVRQLAAALDSLSR